MKTTYAPVRFEKAVRAVPRDEHRLRACPDRPGQVGQGGPSDQKVGELGQVVAGQPEPLTPSGVIGVVGEHHHAAGHPSHLPQPGDRVRPMMNGADRHRGIEGLVRERQAFRGGGHARRRAGRTLRPHDRRRFHRGDSAVVRFVGAGSGPDVQYRPRVSERIPDARGDPRLGTPRRWVGGSDGVVQPTRWHDTTLATSRQLRGTRRLGDQPIEGRPNWQRKSLRRPMWRGSDPDPYFSSVRCSCWRWPAAAGSC